MVSIVRAAMHLAIRDVVWFGLARPDSRLDAAIFAGLLIATLTGAGGFLVYRLTSPVNDFEWLLNQYIRMIEFYVSVIGSFLVGFLGGRKLAKQIENGNASVKLQEILQALRTDHPNNKV